MSDWRRYDSHLIPAFHERFEERWGRELHPSWTRGPMRSLFRARSGSIPPPVQPWPWSPSGPTTTASTGRSGSSICLQRGIFGCFAPVSQAIWSPAWTAPNISWP
jgi:hypothetical protein